MLEVYSDTDANLVSEDLRSTEIDDEKIDELEQSILDGDLVFVDLPLKHAFTPNMYIREIFMPAGTLLTSKIHNTEHPYVVLSGSVRVNIPGVGVKILKAGHNGITEKGTRRVLFIEEDCRWVTFHALSASEEQARLKGIDDEELVSLVHDRIITRRELPGSEGHTAFEVFQKRLKQQELSLSDGSEEGDN